jgi:hypothetical protein
MLKYSNKSCIELSVSVCYGVLIESIWTAETLRTAFPSENARSNLKHRSSNQKGPEYVFNKSCCGDDRARTLFNLCEVTEPPVQPPKLQPGLYLSTAVQPRDSVCFVRRPLNRQFQLRHLDGGSLRQVGREFGAAAHVKIYKEIQV